MRSFRAQFLISRSGVTRIMMALLAIALAISGLTFVGLSLDMGVVLVSVALAGTVVVLQFHEVSTAKKLVLASFITVATVAIAYTVLGASVITTTEVGLIALITAISMAFAVIGHQIVAWLAKSDGHDSGANRIIPIDRRQRDPGTAIAA